MNIFVNLISWDLICCIIEVMLSYYCNLHTKTNLVRIQKFDLFIIHSWSCNFILRLRAGHTKHACILLFQALEKRWSEIWIKMYKLTHCNKLISSLGHYFLILFFTYIFSKNMDRKGGITQKNKYISFF